MKDIKSLYSIAKSSGRQSDIDTYSECINEILNTNPASYISNLKYIIESSIGLETWETFVEKYGVSVAVYDDVISCFENCIKKCESQKKDPSNYRKHLEELEKYKRSFKECFNMYEIITNGSFMEKSHGKLKYDFRMVTDVETDHPLKIVYSLDNMILDEDPSFAHHTSYKKLKGLSKEEKLSRIRSKGNTDHKSSGQKVLAIIDVITNKRLQEADVTGIFGYNDSDIFHIKVGDIENVPTFKSTSMRKNKYDNYRHKNEETRDILNDSITYDIRKDISKKENNGDGRGEQIQNKREKPKDYAISGDIKFYEGEIERAEFNIERCKNNLNDLLKYDNHSESHLRIIEETKQQIKKYENKIKECNDKIKVLKKKLQGKGVTIRGRASRKDPRHSLKESAEEYIEDYYSLNDNSKQGRTFLVGLTEKYEEVAIPDIIITANQLGNNTINLVLEYFSRIYNDPHVSQLIVECCKYDSNLLDNKNFQIIESNSLSAHVKIMQDNNMSIFRESMITGNTEGFLEYTEEDIDNIKDLIELKEYQIVCAESTEEAFKLQDEVYSLYEEFDGLLNEDGTLVKSADPINDDNINESYRLSNTTDKYTGKAPTYLGGNHDLSYGEIDSPDKKNDDTDNENKSLEDFSRPSANKDENDHYDDVSDELGVSSSDKEDHSSTNNYYYYTYNNSMNKNTNSFNRDNDNSKHDNHSVHNINNSRHDNHSVHNIDNSTDKNIKDDHSSKEHNESIVIPYKMNILPNQPFTEGFFDRFRKNYVTEKVGDADDNKPESDHPVKDALTDIDRATTKAQQSAKRTVQNVQNAGRAAIKPIRKTQGWVMKTIQDWKDTDETKIKEKIDDPAARSNLLSAVNWCIKTGAYLKAGLLLNPFFLGFSIARKSKNKNQMEQLRHEMIGEIKTEIEIIEKKIAHAEGKGDIKAVSQLTRLKNQISQKLYRISGPASNKAWRKGQII